MYKGKKVGSDSGRAPVMAAEDRYLNWLNICKLRRCSDEILTRGG